MKKEIVIIGIIVAVALLLLFPGMKLQISDNELSSQLIHDIQLGGFGFDEPVTYCQNFIVRDYIKVTALEVWLEPSIISGTVDVYGGIAEGKNYNHNDWYWFETITLDSSSPTGWYTFEYATGEEAALYPNGQAYMSVTTGNIDTGVAGLVWYGGDSDSHSTFGYKVTPTGSVALQGDFSFRVYGHTYESGNVVCWGCYNGRSSSYAYPLGSICGQGVAIKHPYTEEQPCSTMGHTITVFTTDENGPITDVIVEISGPDHRTDTTGLDSTIEFNNCNPGTYTVSGKKGELTSEKIVVLSSDTSVTLVLSEPEPEIIPGIPNINLIIIALLIVGIVAGIVIFKFRRVFLILGIIVIVVTRLPTYLNVESPERWKCQESGMAMRTLIVLISDIWHYIY